MSGGVFIGRKNLLVPLAELKWYLRAIKMVHLPLGITEDLAAGLCLSRLHVEGPQPGRRLT